MSSTDSYYERYWSEGGFQPSGSMTAPLLQLLRRHIARDACVLDIGCGDGRTAGIWLTEHAAQCRGVDVSEPAVSAARALGLEAQRIDDAASLPFSDESFDAAVCLEVLEHLFEPQLAVSEARRVLRPGGRLIVTVPNVAYWRRRADLAVFGRWNPLGDDLSTKEPWRDPHVRFFERRALHRLLRRAGLEILDGNGFGGTLLGDLPLLRGLIRGRGGWAVPDWTPNPVYGALERRFPALLAYRLYAVARKGRA